MNIDFLPGEIKMSILVVDDDATTRKLIRTILCDIKTEEIIESDSALDALEIIGKCKLKTIITDIKMPGMDGLEFISVLREKGIGIPVIFISGFADKDLAIKALRLGALDFLEKPFQNDMLLAAVTRAIALTDSDVTSRLQSLNLNSTQIKILDMLLKGLGNKEIASRVNLSEHGVKYHVRNLLRRFESSDRSELRNKIWSRIS